MIYDKLSGIGRYKGLHPNIDTAVEFILTHDLNALPDGKSVVDGDNVYVNVVSAACGAERGRYEFHKRYADLHVDLRGEEKMGVSLSAPVPTGRFDEAADGGPCDAPKGAELSLGGNFLLAFPCEPHRPLIAAGRETAVRKCIFKILVADG